MAIENLVECRFRSDSGLCIKGATHHYAAVCAAVAVLVDGLLQVFCILLKCCHSVWSVRVCLDSCNRFLVDLAILVARGAA